jgi:hypothetical protein
MLEGFMQSVRDLLNVDLDGKERSLPKYTRDRDSYNLAAEVNQRYLQGGISGEDHEKSPLKDLWKSLIGIGKTRANGNKAGRNGIKAGRNGIKAGRNGIKAGRNGIGIRLRHFIRTVSAFIRRR